MTRRRDPNKGTLLVRRSNRDRQAAIDSAAKAIGRCDWTSIKVEQDEQDEFGVFHYAVRVLLPAKEVTDNAEPSKAVA